MNDSKTGNKTENTKDIDDLGFDLSDIEDNPTDVKLDDNFLNSLDTVIKNFSLLIKRLVFYGINHQSLNKLYDDLMDNITELLTGRKRIILGIAQDKFLYSGQIIDKKTQYFKDFASHLHRRGIASLTLFQGITKEEIKKFGEIIIIEPSEIRAEGGAAHVFLSAGVRCIEVKDKYFAKLIDEQHVINKKNEEFDSDDFWKNYIDSIIFPDEDDDEGEESDLSKDHLLKRFMTEFRNNPDKIANILNSMVNSGAKSDHTEAILKVVNNFIKQMKKGGIINNIEDFRILQPFFEKLDKEFQKQMMFADLDNQVDLSTSKQSYHEYLSNDEISDNLSDLIQSNSMSYGKINRFFDIISSQPVRKKSILENLMDKLENTGFTEKQNIRNIIDLERFVKKRKELIAPDSPDKNQLILIKKLEWSKDELSDFQEKTSRRFKEVSEGVIDKSLIVILKSMLLKEKNFHDYIFIGSELLELSRYLMLVGQYNDAKKIIELLLDEFTRIGKSAGGTGSKKHVIKKLLIKLQDEDLARDLIKALREWGKDKFESITFILARTRNAAIKPLAEAMIDEEDRAVRSVIVSTLVNFGRRAVPEILKLLNDDKWYVVRNGVSILRRIGDKSSIKEILPLMTYHDHRVRKEIIITMSSLGDDEIIEYLFKMMKDEEPSVQITAVNALLRFKTERIAKHFIEFLKSGNLYKKENSVELRIIKALGELGITFVVDYLGEVLIKSSFIQKVRYETVQIAAAKSLGMLLTKKAESFLRDQALSKKDNDVTTECKKQLAMLTQKLNNVCLLDD